MAQVGSNQRLICASVALLVLLQVGASYGDNLRELSVSDWWEKAGFYQIYPRSYKDSDGDGIGDLKGIEGKLEYLKGIGMKAFWLSPIYKSPMADFGYDIADFVDIQPEYGTMSDFESLVKKAKELGLKLKGMRTFTCGMTVLLVVMGRDRHRITGMKHSEEVPGSGVRHGSSSTCISSTGSNRI
ncbi:hypothetical protein quinque_006123 [Culex quinquefasciatus]